MKKKDQDLLSEKKDLIFQDLKDVLEKHGISNVGVNMTFFRADCRNGYWKAVKVWNPRRQAFDTRYVWVCP